MSTKMKIAMGVVAGAIAGMTVLGTAFAAPRLAASFAPRHGYGMMRPLETSAATFVRPTVEQMTSFMNGYRNADGTVDVAKMHRDVTTGKVTPPCLKGTRPATRSVGPRTGYGMMGRTY